MAGVKRNDAPAGLAWGFAALCASHYLPDAAQISTYFGAKHHHRRLFLRWRRTTFFPILGTANVFCALDPAISRRQAYLLMTWCITQPAPRTLLHPVQILKAFGRFRCPAFPCLAAHGARRAVRCRINSRPSILLFRHPLISRLSWHSSVTIDHIPIIFRLHSDHTKEVLEWP